MTPSTSNLLAAAAAVLLLIPRASAQDDLLSMLDEIQPEAAKTEYAIATFKSTRLITGHSIETNAEGVLNVIIGHRFGRVNGGAYEFFGLDNANVRFGFEYGITDNLDMGYGRNSFEKTYDGYLKYKVLRQSKGVKRMPITLTLFASAAIKTLKWPDETRENYFSSRMYYCFQAMIARKFSERISLQLTPTLVHRNLVATKADNNSVFALGAGGRVKLTGSLALNMEYFWVAPNQIASPINGQKVNDSFSIGFDLETGGHVFQIHATNSRGMVEKMFITETNGDWLNGDIHIGFNITRVFTIYDKHKVRAKKEAKRAAKQAKG